MFIVFFMLDKRLYQLTVRRHFGGSVVPGNNYYGGKNLSSRFGVPGEGSK